ncbi:MAG: hypothetical protein ACI8TX_003982 [Hyphomicrobiaceae bacterium]|jgi:hypothetical protein
MDFPQRGRCLCNAVEYSLTEDPVTVYICHCTDCQRQTASAFAMTMMVRSDALDLVRGEPEHYAVEMSDGRIKEADFCSRCSTRLWGPFGVDRLTVLEPGSLDETSWFRPVGHIWLRSAQPWVAIPDGDLKFKKDPGEDEAENRNDKPHFLKMSGYRCHEEPASLNDPPRTGRPQKRGPAHRDQGS